MDIADPSQLLTELALLDSTRLEPQVESGSHTRPTVNSHTHKEFMREATAQPDLKSQVSWKRSLRIERPMQMKYDLVLT